MVTKLVVLVIHLVKWEAGLLVSWYVGLFPLVLWSVGQLVSWSIGQFNNLVGRQVSWSWSANLSVIYSVDQLVG